MKYVRTKDGRIIEYLLNGVLSEYDFDGTDKSADTIEELCDEFVVITSSLSRNIVCSTLDIAEDMSVKGQNIYGAIWTDKGLIYVAKMNKKGELELL